MSDGKRQTAPNLAELLDHQRQYMNDRLSALAGIGLVEKVGPSNNSGMYTITTLGEAAVDLREDYDHKHTVEWGEKVRGRADLLKKSETLDENGDGS